ncbi:MAG: DUF6577 family protein [Candidatus Woesearchaeota archaeon]
MSGEQKEGKLKEVFAKKHFSEKDIVRVLSLSQSNAHYFRFKLLKQKKITRVARGKYRFCSLSSSAYSKYFKHDPLMEYIQKSLLQLNKKFAITGSSFFNRFYPLTNYITINVQKGCAELFLTFLLTLHLDFVILDNPQKKDIELLMNHTHKMNFIIIRENNYFYSSKDGLASVESAFVDYYYDITRQKLPLENKIEDILDYLMAHHNINKSTMLRYAKERGIRKEIEALLGEIKVLRPENVEKVKLESEKAQQTSVPSNLRTFKPSNLKWGVHDDN